MTLYL